MRMAWKGQTTAQAAQPVQPVGWCSTARFCQWWASSHKTLGGQVATQRPHPVQRWLMAGKAPEAAVLSSMMDSGFKP
jgi:hypothetical protein